MTEPLILAVDQGTTNTKAMLVGPDGAIRGAAAVRVGIEFPRPGWAQSDPLEIWRSVEQAVAACTSGLPGGAVAAVAISNQRETAVVWERASGMPLGPAISWQCTRTTDRCERLRAEGADRLVNERTGLPLEPMFTATKLAWLLDAIDDGAQRAANGELCLGTVDSWLVWKLTGGETFATDHTNASRTLLLDLARRAWDDELLQLFAIPRCSLPTVQASIAPFGVARLFGGVPIAAVAGDSHAALVGHRALTTGAVKATFGTGTSVMAPVDALTRASDLTATVAWSQCGTPADHATYAIEGNISATGAALEWTATLLGLDGDVPALGALAGECATSGGVSFVPALAGLGAPHWAPLARGVISGLTRAAGRAEVARAAFDGVAHQVADVLDRTEAALGTPLQHICADGGAIRSDLLAAAVADVAGVPVVRSDQPDVAAFGAALLAGVSTGIWPDLQATLDLPTPTTTFEPRSSATERQRRRDEWADAIRRATLVPGQS